MDSLVKRAVQRALAGKHESEELSPLEIAAEEFANARNAKDRAEALQAFVELAQNTSK